MAYAICLLGPSGIQTFEIYDQENVVDHFIQRVLQLASEVKETISKTNNFSKPTPDILEKVTVKCARKIGKRFTMITCLVATLPASVTETICIFNSRYS